MDNWMELLPRLVRQGHYLTTAELQRAGFGRVQIHWAERLFRFIRRVDRGLYVDAKAFPPLDVRWVVLHARVPRGIVTLETAAASHGLLPWPGGPLWMALPHSEHPPRTSIGGLAFQYLRAPFSSEECEPFNPPGMPGLELLRFVPLRVFAELATARRMGAAEEVGRGLRERGVPEADLASALAKRRVGSATARRLLAATSRRP